jgi:hypothetical protein
MIWVSLIPTSTGEKERPFRTSQTAFYSLIPEEGNVPSFRNLVYINYARDNEHCSKENSCKVINYSA